MAETWKDVAGYEGLYQVSDQGNVRSRRRRGSSGGILKPKVDRNGYVQVELYRKGQRKNILVHRLVAETFIPNPLNLPQVNHKDENPKNNAVDNLEWCTQKYNLNYGTCPARIAAKLLNGPCAKAVFQYDKFGNLIKEWPSTIEIQRQTGFAQSNISDCCLGKRKSANGYIWRFK
jgi:hypothetical protein